jgi:hypothetical protein
MEQVIVFQLMITVLRSRTIPKMIYVHVVGMKSPRVAAITTIAKCQIIAIIATGKVRLTMANNLFYYVKVWCGLGKSLNGTLINIQEYQSLLHSGYVLHSFTGRVATVCVVSQDLGITRIQKLDFATIFMKGEYVTISVDLKNLTSTTTIGKPPP